MFAFLALTLALSGRAAPDDSLMTPGVSHALAVYRADHIRDVRYWLQLAPGFDRPDIATGRVHLEFTRVNGGDVILDFRGDPRLRVVDINGAAAGDDGEHWPSGTGGMVYNGAHLRIPAHLLRDGANAIGLAFTTPIAASGASIIRFRDETDRREYLYTLLVPSDANLLFPCFDQPDLKAVFKLTLHVPSGWDALSNGAVVQREASTLLADGSEITFAPTKPIPTYLFAFATGPWAVLRQHAPGASTPPSMRKSAERPAADSSGISLWVRASRAKEVETDSLIALSRAAKAWLAEYFGVPYPFDKFDFMLAPAFPFGGMEHPGAIFYNEESFIYREPPTLVQRLGRTATIDHEVAHQWFGDFTTMKWFDDLWLKEGFATYMAAKMQAALGGSSAWMSFYLRNKPAAYDVDASLGTTPVWQELGNLDQAKSNYGAIVYNKAPGVLKQLNYLVGEPAFRKGVHDFLTAHAYGNGTWQDLLGAIGRAAGRDLTDWGRAYFLRPGMPVVEQQLEIGANDRIRRLALIQHPAQPLSGSGVWPMKVEVRLRYPGKLPVVLPVEMKAETTYVEGALGLPAPDFVYANANDHGYGLFMLDARSRDWLLANRVHVADTFLRAMLWGSLWDLVRDARLDPARFVDAGLAALPAEQDEQIAAQLMGRVTRALNAYVAAETAGQLRERAEALFLTRASDTTLGYGMRKSYLDNYVAVARTPAALARLDAWLDSANAAGMPLRQPTRWSVVTTLVARGVPASASRLSAEAARDSSTGGRRRAFVASAAFGRAEVKGAYFERYFADSALNEEWVTASLGAFNVPDQAELTRPYLRPALDSLPWIQKNRRIFFLGSWLGAFIGGQRSPEALAEVDRYLAEHPQLPRDLRLKVLQARDDLERTVRIRATY